MRGDTTLGRDFSFAKYTGVNIPESDGHEQPVYLDSKSNPRDRFYRPVKRPVFGEDDEANQLCDPFSGDVIPLVYHVPSEAFPFPNPADFETRAAFLNECENWHSAFRKRLSTVVLPCPVTGELCVPDRPKIFKPEEKSEPQRFRTFKAAVWNLMPTNYMEMLDVLYKKREVDPEAPFPEQVPQRKGDVIMYKYHVSSKRQWQSQHFCHEPVPQIYDTYEEFEQSYKNWSAVVSEEVQQPIMQPGQFSDLIGLGLAEQSKEKLILVEKEKKKVRISKGSWKWVKEARKIKDQKALKKKLRHLAKDSKIREFSCVPDEVCDVFGVPNKDVFVRQMMKWGDALGTREPTRLERPIAFIVKLHEDPQLEEFVELFRISGKCDIGMLLRLLEVDFTQKQLDEFMMSRRQETTLVDFILSSLTQQVVRMLFSCSHYIERYQFRLSYFFRACLRNDDKSQLLVMLLDCLQDYHDVVRSILLTIDMDLKVLPLIPQNGDELLDKINRFYLFHLTVIAMNKVQDKQFYRDCVRKMRVLAHDIAKALPTEEEVQKVRSNHAALMMLLHCDSNEIHKRILGPNFLVWLNDLSTTREGGQILQTIAHGSCLNCASFMFLKHGWEVMKTLAPKMTVITSIFVKHICNYLLVTCERIHIQFRGQNLLAALDAASGCISEHMSSMMIPLAKLVSRPGLISNINQQSYFPLTMASVVKICRECKKEVTNDVIYSNQIKVLDNMAVNENCCFSMTQQKTFLDCLAEHLAYPDVGICDLTWAFLLKLCSSTKTMMEVLSYPPISEKIVGIPSSTKLDRHAIFHVMRLFVQVWTGDSKEMRKMVCDMFMSAIGSIVCLYRTRHVIFRNDRANRQAMKAFHKAVTDKAYTDADTKEFVDKVKQHLTSGTNDAVLNNLRRSLKR